MRTQEWFIASSFFLFLAVIAPAYPRASRFKDDKKGKSCTNPITKQQAEEDPYCTVHSKMARGLPVGPGAGSWSGPGTPAHDGGDDFDDM
jgi:hypothetical protein